MKTTKQPTSSRRHLRLVLPLLVSLLVGGCRDPVCTSGTNHKWGKWHADGRTNLDGQTWLIRECSECGWQQGKPADNYHE